MWCLGGLPLAFSPSAEEVGHMPIVVGVDVGKGRHQAAAYAPSGERWLGQLSFEVGRAGFGRFLRFLQRLAQSPAELSIGLEATGH
jgi:Transposase